MQRLLAAFAAACLVSVAKAEDRIPIENFFKLPEYASMRLSPDGKNIAALAPFRGRQNVVIIDVEKRKARPISGLEDRDVVAVEWLSNKRIYYRTGRLGELDVNQRGGGTFSVDADGSNPRLISEGSDERSQGGARVTFRAYEIVRRLPNDSDDIIVQETIFSPGRQPQAGPLYRVDTRTARKLDISIGKPEAALGENWVVDGKGVARLFIASDEAATRVYYRPNADAPWKKVEEHQRYEGAGGWTPLSMAEDDRTVYVASRRGRDKAAIYRYDPETGKLGDLVAQHPQVDLQTLVYDRDGIPRGVSFDANEPGTAWFDDAYAKTQAIVDKALPDRANAMQFRANVDLALITSFSDVEPGSFYLLDRKTNKMEWLGDRRPWIKSKEMSHMQAVRYKARDGLEIPAFVTVPRGSSGKNLPAVVMIHGGPWVDGDSWGWNPEVQFLASRGYAVLQPNYRGTTRYGYKHWSSSFRQYGLTMQDDVTDGVEWLVKEGIADPNRICIYGGSYGGYAAMMGVAKTPDLFKCAVNYVGVTDLPLRITASWADSFGSDFASYAFKYQYGNLDNPQDRKRLEETSPVNLASRIKVPVLMAYGGSDVRVVPEHGTRMRDAMVRAGNTPQWIIVDDEGHGYRKLENQVMFYGAMEKFLEKNLGPGKP
jgi:dipeptidyl aminopeptidase/acylaminoacyl peptidase